MAFRCRPVLQQLCVGASRTRSRLFAASSTPVLNSTQPAYDLPKITEEQDPLGDRMKEAFNKKQDSVAEKIKESLKYPDYFKLTSLFSVEDLFNARVHLGHKDGSLHANMTPFIFGSRIGHLIFDLDQTAEHLRQALNFIAHIAFRNGIILFIGRTPQHQIMIEKMAKECGEYAHTRPWMRGIMTNSTMSYGCVTRLPDLVVFFNTLDTGLQQHLAVRDSAKMLIPTVGVVDSNCDPNLITYPIPGNDDTTDSMYLYCKLFKEAVLRGKSKRKELEL